MNPTTTPYPPNCMNLNLLFENRMTSNVGGNNSDTEGQPIVNLSIYLDDGLFDSKLVFTYKFRACEIKLVFHPF